MPSKRRVAFDYVDKYIDLLRRRQRQPRTLQEFTTLSEELADEKIKAVKAYPRTTEDLIFNDEGATGFAKRFVELSIGVRGGQE